MSLTLGKHVPRPKITQDRLRIFVSAIMEGKSKSAAYRQMHPNAKAWKHSAVTNKASIWFAQVEVQEELKIRRHEAQRQTVTNVFLIDQMHREAFELAREQGNPAAMTQAAKNLAQLHGLEAPKQVDIRVTVIQRAWRVIDTMNLEQVAQVRELLQNGTDLVNAVEIVSPNAIDEIDIGPVKKNPFKPKSQ